MRIAEIWRYPVKSMLGERLERTRLGSDGIPGDRGLGVRDLSSGRIVSAKRAPELLRVRAATTPAGVVLTLPGGDVLPVADPGAARALSRVLGRAVEIVAASGSAQRPSIEGEDGTFLGRAGDGFFDGAPIHIVTTATLALLASLYPEGAFDARRFRPNLLIEAAGADAAEQDWIGSTIAVGSAHLVVTKPCTRCVMTTAAQDELPTDRGILRTVAREQDNVTGVYAQVAAPGEVARGDQIVLAGNHPRRV